MNWTQAQAWIAALNSASYLGVSNWRLPNTTQPDATCFNVDANGQNYGTGCTDSEMANLFYNVLGGIANYTIAITHNDSYSLFSNVEALGYWSGTQYAPDPDKEWAFGLGTGALFPAGNSIGYYAWAVSPGDTVAPILPTAFLFPSALAALELRRRRAVA
jgi:hypothetical protein